MSVARVTRSRRVNCFGNISGGRVEKLSGYGSSPDCLYMTDDVGSSSMACGIDQRYVLESIINGDLPAS